MHFGNRDVNENWIAGITQSEFVEYALTNWANHSDMKGKNKKQRTDYLKAIYRQCKEATWQPVEDVTPDNTEVEQKGGE